MIEILHHFIWEGIPKPWKLLRYSVCGDLQSHGLGTLRPCFGGTSDVEGMRALPRQSYKYLVGIIIIHSPHYKTLT